MGSISLKIEQRTFFGARTLTPSGRSIFAPKRWSMRGITISLITDIHRVSQNPRVPAAQRVTTNVLAVRVLFFFASGCLSIPFGLQSMATLEEGDQWQMWEFIRI